MRDVVYDQVRKLTQNMIRYNFSVSQNFPKLSDNEITWEGYKDIAYALKNVDYDDMYKAFIDNKAFNLLLIDGAIVQIMYRFYKREIISHRLAFYPSPILEKYQEDPENYEKMHYGEQLFTEITKRKLICTPIRFDYDIDIEKHVDCDHPKSHMTIGNYKDCRIPLNTPLSPNRFIKFILRNFYFIKYKENMSDKMFECNLKFVDDMSANEMMLLHMRFF